MDPCNYLATYASSLCTPPFINRSPYSMYRRFDLIYLLNIVIHLVFFFTYNSYGFTNTVRRKETCSIQDSIKFKLLIYFFLQLYDTNTFSIIFVRGSVFVLSLPAYLCWLVLWAVHMNRWALLVFVHRRILRILCLFHTRCIQLFGRADFFLGELVDSKSCSAYSHLRKQHNNNAERELADRNQCIQREATKTMYICIKIWPSPPYNRHVSFRPKIKLLTSKWIRSLFHVWYLYRVHFSLSPPPLAVSLAVVRSQSCTFIASISHRFHAHVWIWTLKKIRLNVNARRY